MIAFGNRLAVWFNLMTLRARPNFWYENKKVPYEFLLFGMQLFYAPNILAGSRVLSPEESRHCVQVLRKTVGDEIKIVDGAGGLYTALLTELKPKKCSFEISETVKAFGKRENYLHVLVAPTKNISRVEWFLEKATELGVDEISFVKSFHSERKVVKLERLQRILVGAMKQSLKAYLPKLNDLEKFDQLISKNYEGARYIACMPEKERHLFSEAASSRTHILIGPEGGFSDQEIEKAVDAGWSAVSLGKERLRTETAALAAVHTVALKHSFS